MLDKLQKYNKANAELRQDERDYAKLCEENERQERRRMRDLILANRPSSPPPPPPRSASPGPVTPATETENISTSLLPPEYTKKHIDNGEIVPVFYIIALNLLS